MATSLLVVIGGAALFAVLAALVITWRSSRSALSNMAFAALLALGAILTVIVVSLVLTHLAFSR